VYVSRYSICGTLNVIVPVIIGATATVTKGLRKNLEVIPGIYSIFALQKTAVLGT
jgi:hypothetical protein